MPDLSRRAVLIRVAVYVALQVALGAAFLLFGEHAASTFPLDDAYIHQVYAEGLAYGDGLSYNPGVPAAGTTSPLWALLLAPFHIVGLGASVLLTKLLGLTLAVALAFIVDRLATTLAGAQVGLAAGVLVAIDPALTFGAVSGMEVTLAACALMGALLAVARGRTRWGGLLLAAAIASRPELTLAWLVVGASAWHLPKRERAWLVVPGLLVLGGWSAWCLHATNSLLPTTFYAKHAAVSLVSQWKDVPLGFLVVLGGPLLGLIGLPLAALGARRCLKQHDERRRLRIAIIALAVVLPLGLAWAHDLREMDFYWSRYGLPVRPLVLLLMAVGAASLPRRPRVVAMVVGTLLCSVAAWQAVREYAGNCRNIFEIDVQAAQWVNEHSTDADWIAANDAGAMRVVGQRRVIDLLGLNDHRMIRGQRDQVLAETPPRYYVVFESWYPELASRLPIVARFRSEPYTICGECEQSEILILDAR